MSCPNPILQISDLRYAQLDEKTESSGPILTNRTGIETTKKWQQPQILLPFQGEACLRDYALGTSIASLLSPQPDKIIPRSFQKLSVDMLPSRCLLYQRQQQFYFPTQATIERGTVCLDSNSSNWPQRQQKGQKITTKTGIQYTLSTLPKSAVLFAVQTLAFYPLSLADFKEMFGSHLFYSKRLITQSTSCLTQTINIPARFRPNDLANVDKEHNVSDQNQVRFYDVADHSTDLLEFMIFKQFCVEGIDWSLWPCLVLQPLAGTPLDAEKVADQDQLFWSQGSQEEENMFNNAIEAINKDQPRRSCGAQGEQQEITQIIGKIKGSLCKQNVVSIIKLVGTNKTIKTATNLLPWVSLTQHQLAIILNQPQIQYLASCLNKHIQSLNNYKLRQYFPSEQGSCLGRVCRYHPPEGQPDEICIALKQNPTTESNNIYVRMLNPSNQKYLWVSQSTLTINLTLPHFSKRQDFQRVATQLSVEDTIKLLQQGAHPFQDTIDEIVPDNIQNQSEQQIKESCPKCQQSLSPIFVYSKRCRHCINLHYQQLEQYLKSIDSSNSLKPQRCHVCCTLKQSYTLKCCKCKRNYHWQCLKDNPRAKAQSKQQQIVCTQCLFCEFCRQPISSVPYLLKSKLYCQECHFQQQSHAFCGGCQCKIEKESYFLCSDQACAKKVHHSCDPLVTHQWLSASHKYSYLCPQCRLSSRRKLLRWILQDLRIFDECQYYCDPCYQQFIDYDKVIKNPMCLAIMREKIVQGCYDCSSFQRFKKDFELIIKNALTFNAPHDDAYYRAKIFYIVGMQFLDHCRDLLEIRELQLMNVSMEQLFESRVGQFFNFLRRNYASLVLNHQQEKVIVQVQMPNNRNYYERFLFKSRELLQAQLQKYPLKVRVKVNPRSIDNLFNAIPKRKGIVAPISQRICFKHPNDTHPLVYQCQLCWEYYCCTKGCPSHSSCLKCPKHNCTCSSRVSQCKCNGRVSDYIKQKVVEFAESQSLTMDDVTEYSRYCLRCTQRNIVNRRCLHCEKFCYYGYQQCKYCKKYEHLLCLQQKVKIQVSIDKQLQGWNFDISNVKQCCFDCLSKGGYRQYSQRLLNWVQTNSSHKIKQQKYLPIIIELYRSQGIRLDTQKSVYALLNRSETEWVKIERFLQEMSKNRSIISNLLVQLQKENAKNCNRFIQHCGSLSSKELYLTFQQLIDQDLKTTLNDYDHLHRKRWMTSNQVNNESQRQKINVWPFYQSNTNRNILIRGPSSQQGQILPPHQRDQQKNYQHYPTNQTNPISSLSELEYVRDVDVKWQVKLKYVKAVLLSIYRDNQRVLKHGNVCILRKSQNHWKCLKYFQETQYVFQLYKENSQWHYSINQNAYPVSDTSDIIQRTNTVNPNIANNQDLITFLGFDVEFPAIKDICLSQLLKKPALVDRSRHQRKKIVEAAFSKSQDAEEKEVVDRITKDQHKQNIFYLRKREKQTPIKQSMDSRLNVKVTLHELKRDLHLDPRPQRAEVADSKLRHMEEGALYVAPSQIDRLGIFTTQPIDKNTIVIEYKGELISQAIADKRQKSYRFGCYMFSLDHSAPERATVIDATFKGNMARYLNHSCNPNCRGKISRSSKQPAIVIYTIRKVKAYEQLTYNYEFKKETNQIIGCKCKAPNCQQRLN